MGAVHPTAPGTPYPMPGDKVAGQSDAHEYHVTPSLDPGVIQKGIEGFDEHAGYLQVAVNAFSEAHVSLQKLGEARKLARRNGAWTEAQQLLVVAQDAERAQERMCRAMDNARTTLAKGIAHTEAELSKPLQSAADVTVSAEMRNLFRSLKSEERNTLLSEALADNDARVLHATLGCHHALAGLSKAEQSHWTRKLHEKNNPQVVSRLEAMKKAHALVERNGSLVMIEVEKAIGASWTKINRVKNASTAAEQALAMLRGDVIP